MFHFYLQESLDRSGSDASKRKVKGTLHWVTQRDSIKAEVRIYDRLFNTSAPDKEKKNFKSFLNESSLKVIYARVEPSLVSSKPGDRFQFQRLGYFVVDKESCTNNLVFNKTVGLRDTWSKTK